MDVGELASFLSMPLDRFSILTVYIPIMKQLDCLNGDTRNAVDLLSVGATVWIHGIAALFQSQKFEGGAHALSLHCL